MEQTYYFVVIGTDDYGEYTGDFDYQPMREESRLNDLQKRVILYPTLESAKEAMESLIDTFNNLAKMTDDTVYDIERFKEGLRFKVGCKDGDFVRFNVDIYIDVARLG